ncbi:PrsW family intramembrane metalloprotease [Corynebacterium pseudopelargi]|uniref:Protease PrsW n=1 Tax=Corynebacterium pseudopelargi TaxID=2080757 RepID=A0A3G6IUY9_9CORY|nr:PrsW family intramembrane metalloprotease [Corynebacterium pseudopelargi]AZA08428.1 hypothetical protein CPPEL_01405 [Corynebacterium pseudopelargi]
MHEFFRPQAWTWWVFVVSVALGTAGVSIAVAQSFQAASESLWTIAPLFALTLAIFVGIILLSDPYRSRRPWVLLLAMIFGATVPTWLAIHANEHIVRITADLLPQGVGAAWGAAAAGPTSEEWSKMLGVFLVMLIASNTMRRPMHGLLAGAFVGLGFQIFENVSYAANLATADANSNLQGALGVTILRSLVGIASHWLYTGIIGVGVAIALGRSIKQRSLPARIGAFIGFFLLGWGLHFIWNAPLGEDLGIVLMAIKIIIFLVIFSFVARYAFKEERSYLEQASTHLTQPAPAVAAAIAPRRQRRKALKGSDKKQVKRERKQYLDQLQALAH